MRTRAAVALVSLTAAVAVGLGYWWGSGSGGAGAATTAPSGASPSGETTDRPRRGRILYYKHPMGLPDTSPVPKKDEMGMDYIPVYEGEEPRGAGVKISLERLQTLGVRTEPVQRRELVRTVRATGTLELDERRISTVSPKFEGWIERLHVNATGGSVERGAPLLEVYSPDLVTTQQEYLIAVRGLQTLEEADPEVRARMQSLIESSLQRLRNWDIAPAELERLRTGGEPRRTLLLRSPVSGVVLEKPALQGMRFMPGEMLYKLADLSSLWLIVEVFEQDLALVRHGQHARVWLDTYPGEPFEGRVTFIYPTLSPETRTARVRIELANPAGRLKPAMYARVEFHSRQPGGAQLVVPVSAVLDSGTRQVVLLERSAGRFEPREVVLGFRGDGYVQVLRGVDSGERVVVSANFLIDAESNLKAALESFGHAHGGTGAGAAAAQTRADEPSPPARGQPRAGAEASQAAPKNEHAGH